ncbi:penicillin-binding protein 1B [Agaribacter flavus]|uniref:Penicillin-binding protein 1B n=1 Tax=Agaribacter flavus TaxID=1902781 RepID=A0ABV7FVY2_9ALTE
MKVNYFLMAPFRWFKRHFFQILLVSIVALGSYFFYLDAQVKQRFSGNKWEVPAQVYARPMVIAVQQEISPNEIIDELQLLGYRKVNTVVSVGEYAFKDNKLKIYRRAFNYIDIDAPERIVEITWQAQKVSQINLLSSKQKSRRIMLEPWLVSRLVGGLDEDRMLVQEGSIPDILKIALTEVEDKAFYEHHGISPIGILRALVANLSAGKTVQGGSTLTQQLVKNLFLTRERSYLRKIREAAMAIVIDARYSKAEILNAYINEVFLGQNGAVAVHGFGLASHFYFNKPVPELALEEVATLVAMVKGPSYYNPVRYNARTQERRNLVLRMLFDAQHIDASEYETAINAPLVTYKSGSLASGKHPAFMDKLKSEIKQAIDTQEIRESGIKLYTTLDINVQRRAEGAVQKVLNDKQNTALPELEAAMIVSDIDTGGIRAIVGGKDTAYAGFNRALHASRPIGSLIKPIVYLTALSRPERYNLASPIEDKPITLANQAGKTWQPQNADKQFRGKVLLIDALVHSYNIPAVNVAMDIGLEEVINTLTRLGVGKQVDLLPSIALGAIELSPLEVNQSYQTLANQGEQIKLHSLSAVVNNSNEVIWRRNTEQSQSINSDVAYLLSYALHKVTQEGTAKRLGKRFPKVNMAGKTGTTNDYRDSWFSGFDRNLLTTIWLGNDENKPVNMSGATGAMEIFSDFQRRQTPKSLSQRFPPSLTIAHFNASSGELTSPGCGEVVSLPAIKSYLPLQSKCNNILTEEAQPKKSNKKPWWEKLFN